MIDEFKAASCNKSCGSCTSSSCNTSSTCPTSPNSYQYGSGNLNYPSPSDDDGDLSFDCNQFEKWCEKKGIDIEKVPERILNTVVSRTEDDIDEYLKEKNEEIDFVNEWAWLEIEQHLEDHPEWKLNTESEDKTK